MKVIYIAGPFRAPTQWQIEQNVRQAETVSLEVWRMGMVAICPHTQTRFFQSSASDETFLNGTLEMMRRCDAVLVVGDAESVGRSSGTMGEIAEAKRLGKPVYPSLAALFRAESGL